MFRLLGSSRPIAAAIIVLFATPLYAQFVAFNDHAPGSGTYSNTTTWNCLVAPTGGLLKNITNGVDTAVSLNISQSGIGTAVNATLAGNPQIGTPANITFTNYVDFQGAGQASVQISNVVLHYTFTGLDPAKRYNFIGSAVRGGLSSNYSNRWTKVAINGADSFLSDHTANVITTDQEPTLAANEAAVNFGVNFTGDEVVWDQIDPGPDGAFEITCEFYRGPLPPPNSATANNPQSGFAITAIRLAEFLNITEPIAFTSGPDPSSTNIVQGQTAQFEVAVSGTLPHFRWFRTDGQPITRAVSLNSSTLTLTNAQPSDGEPTSYQVEVTNSISTNISSAAILQVQADLTPPAIISALALANGSNFLVTFSEPLDLSTGLATNAFHIYLATGGGDLSVSEAVFVGNSAVLLTTDGIRASNANYSLTIDAAAVVDANGNPFAGDAVALATEVALLSFEGTPWKFRADGVDLGTDWYLDPNYDDSGWLDGVSVFDGKTPQPPGRMTVAGFTVTTQLPLTNSDYATTAAVIPTYYYRTHFNLATTPDHVLSLKLRTLVDDFDDFFLNHVEAYQNPGYPATNPPPTFGYSGGTPVGTASVVGPLEIPPQTLVEGDNIAAVIVNQVGGGSSDITFAYELIAVIDQFPEPPRLTISKDPSTGAILIIWADPSAQLFEASLVDAAPPDWSFVTSGGSFTVTPVPGSGQRFYTLRQGK